jgi:D-amino-acid dehydrogenase
MPAGAAGRRVGVIGAGIVGVVAASSLQRDGHGVVLIDRTEPGRGASFGNAGCFSGSSVVPLALPGMIRSLPRWLSDPEGPLAVRWSYLPAITPWLIRFARSARREKVRAAARALRPLLGPSLEVLEPLAAAAGAEDLVHRRGHLSVYRSAEALAGDRLAWELRRENGVEVLELEGDELRQLEPSLSREYRHGVLVRENGHTSDPFQLVERLFKAFCRAGGRFVCARATGFRLAGNRLAAIRTDTGELAADAAVVAAGAYSRPLALSLGERLPLETERGYHLMVRDPEAAPRLPVAEAEGKFVATPMEGGLRFAGTVELAGLSAAPNWRRAQILLEAGRKMLPGLAKDHPQERISMWMGHRPSLPDSLPVIGPARECPDVIYAFGHGHVGITAAPMTGRIVADLMSGRPPAVDIAPFSARRF